MNIDAKPRKSRLQLTAIVAASTFACAGLSACSNQTPSADVAVSDAPAFATPLATSMQALDGSWVTVPMGNLAEPLNTFWQLFFRPTSSSNWSNQVEFTAAATNGGLVLASASNDVLVGVRPSNKLTFSPLVVTANGGGSWSNGLLTSGLAPRPSAIALGPGGEALALATGTGGDRALSSENSFTSWRTVATRAALASISARSCDPAALTAVAYLGSSPVVGASCAGRGVVGIFIGGTKGFELDAPPLPASLEGASTQVLDLQTTAAGLSALVGVKGRAGEELLACQTGDGGTWTVSAPLTVARSEQVASFGPARGGGTFVLLRQPSGTERAVFVEGPGTSWNELPAPPPMTATLSFEQGPVLQALAVNDTVLKVWTLDSGSASWAQTQMIKVAIQFGSSG